jgi:hypothetical protein
VLDSRCYEYTSSKDIEPRHCYCSLVQASASADVLDVALLRICRLVHGEKGCLRGSTKTKVSLTLLLMGFFIVTKPVVGSIATHLTLSHRPHNTFHNMSKPDQGSCRLTFTGCHYLNDERTIVTYGANAPEIQCSRDHCDHPVNAQVDVRLDPKELLWCDPTGTGYSAKPMKGVATYQGPDFGEQQFIADGTTVLCSASGWKSHKVAGARAVLRSLWGSKAGSTRDASDGTAKQEAITRASGQKQD